MTELFPCSRCGRGSRLAAIDHGLCLACSTGWRDEMVVLPEYVVGAIRLALEGAANDEAALTLTKWLVEQAPPTKDGDVNSVKLLLDGIRELGYSVGTEAPSGAYAPA